MVPAPVVVGRPAPRLVRHPGPAVRRPRPAAVDVRLPADRHVRTPDVADAGLEEPRAVPSQVVRVGADLLRQFLCGAAARPGLVLAEVGVPAREVVRLRAVEPVGAPGPRPAAREGPLAGAHADLLARVQGRLALVHRHARLGSGHVHPVGAALAQVGAAVRRLDREACRPPSTSLLHVEAARPESQDDGAGRTSVLALVVQLAAAVEAHARAVPEVELDAPVRVGPDAIARQEREVRNRLLGGRVRRALQRHRRLGHPDARGRKVLGPERPRGAAGDRQQPPRSSSDVPSVAPSRKTSWTLSVQAACRCVQMLNRLGVSILRARQCEPFCPLGRSPPSYGATSVTNSVLVRASNSTEPRAERYLRSSGASSAARA